MGIHLLARFLEVEKGKAYCLVRKGKYPTAGRRLRNLFHYYFEERYDEALAARVEVFDGDVTDPASFEPILARLGHFWKAIGEDYNENFVRQIRHGGLVVAHGIVWGLIAVAVAVDFTSLATFAEEVPWHERPPVALRPGDVVLRRGDGVWTEIFIRKASREKRFSHIGIVTAVSNGVTIVHSEANDFTGIGSVQHGQHQPPLLHGIRPPGR